MTPWEFDRMAFYRIQWLFEDFEELIKLKNSSSENATSTDKDVKSYISNAKSMVSRLQSDSAKNFKMPNLKIPKI